MEVGKLVRCIIYELERQGSSRFLGGVLVWLQLLKTLTELGSLGHGQLMFKKQQQGIKNTFAEISLCDVCRGQNDLEGSFIVLYYLTVLTFCIR